MSFRHAYAEHARSDRVIGFAGESQSLGELSFKLHKELADGHDGRRLWGYSRSTGSSYSPSAARPSRKRSDHGWMSEGRSRAGAAVQHEFRSSDGGPSWLARYDGDRNEPIGEKDSVAQVDPLRLCQFLLQKCRDNGVHVMQPATATGFVYDEEGDRNGLTIELSNGTEERIQCQKLLLAAGAWTQRVYKHLFPKSSLRLPISQLAGHSIVVRSPRWAAEHENEGCHAVFSSSINGWSPEIFSRMGSEIYLAGLNSSAIPLPDLPHEATIDKASIAELLETSRKMLGSESVDDLQVIREGLCFRPVTPHGQPILDRVPSAQLGPPKDSSLEVYVAAGHGPWGIALSLGTGKVMSEMMLGQKLSASIDELCLS